MMVVQSMENLLPMKIGHGAEYEAGAGAPAAAIPDGEQDDRQHLQRDRAAVGELIELDKAQNLRHSDKNGGLTEGTGLIVFHVFGSPPKKIPAWRAMQASQCGT